MRKIVDGGVYKVIEEMRRLRDDYGVNDVLVGPWRGPTSKEVTRSFELFAAEVMSAL